VAPILLPTAADGVIRYYPVAPGPWTFRELGTFRVKGREGPVALYELLDPDTYAAPDDLCTQFEDALALYQQGKFREAKTAFEACQSLHDGPSSFYIDRCRQYQHEPDQHEAALDLRNST
jgi:hypothetical protein